MAGQQTGLHIAIQRADHCRGDHTFRRAADAIQHVDFAVRHAGQDRGGNVTVRDSKHAHAELLHLRDSGVVARFRQNGDGEFAKGFAQGFGDVVQVLFQRQAKVDCAFCARTDNQLFHVHIRRVEEATLIAHGQHR